MTEQEPRKKFFTKPMIAWTAISGILLLPGVASLPLLALNGIWHLYFISSLEDAFYLLGSAGLFCAAIGWFIAMLLRRRKRAASIILIVLIALNVLLSPGDYIHLVTDQTIYASPKGTHKILVFSTHDTVTAKPVVGRWFYREQDNGKVSSVAIDADDRTILVAWPSEDRAVVHVELKKQPAYQHIQYWLDQINNPNNDIIVTFDANHGLNLG